MNKWLLMKKCLIIAVHLFLVMPGIAQTNTWLGTSGTDWHNPCNWSLAAVPTANHDAVIPTSSNYPVISNVAHCNTLTITSAATSAVTINSSGGGSLCVKSNTGSCSGTPTNNGGCPITATFTYAPSVDNPGAMDPNTGTFTQLLHVTNPSNTSSISKRLACVIHNINGGDGGPYSVDFDNVNYTIHSIGCGPGASVTGVDLRWYNTVYGAAQLTSQPNSGSFPNSAVVTGVSGSNYAWCGATAVWSGVPNYPTTVIHTFSGNVIVSDNSGNTLTIALPSGSEGSTNASTGTYTDTWPINTNNPCP